MERGGETVIPSQMLKGTLEGCILAVMERQETYGYEISQQLERFGFGKIAEGTIYPLLLRLEKNGLAEAVYRQSEVGPRRKYYRLTAAGERELAEFIQNYRALQGAVDNLLREMKGEADHEPENQAAACGQQ